MQQHFVTFYSTGTFVHEETSKPIAEWDVTAAVVMAREVRERYGARPFGFRFTTRARIDVELDSKEVARSPMHYLGGRIETREEIEARNDPKEDILRLNMRSNGIERVLVNDNSWRATLPLNEEDVVLDVSFP